MNGYGDRTVSQLVGEKWSRILSETLAAAYVKLTLEQFRRIPEYAALVREYPGVPRGVDRFDLDLVVDNFKSAGKLAGRACK